MGPEFSESSLQKAPCLEKQIGLAAARNIANVRGDRSDSSPRFPEDMVQARIKRWHFKAEAYAGQRPRGVHQEYTEGPMGSPWGIIKPIRGPR